MSSKPNRAGLILGWVIAVLMGAVVVSALVMVLVAMWRWFL